MSQPEAESGQASDTPGLYTLEDLEKVTDGVRRFKKSQRQQRNLTRPQRIGIDWTRAEVGYRGYVCGPVVTTVIDGSTVFVNLGKDYPDPGRLSVVGWNAAADPDLYMSLRRGSRVCARGAVISYEGVRQIQMSEFTGRLTPVQ